MAKNSFVNKRIYKRNLTYAILLTLIITLPSIFFVGYYTARANPGSTPVFEHPIAVRSYLVWQEDSTAYRKDQATGEVATGTDQAILQDALTNIVSAGGGDLFINKANYTITGLTATVDDLRIQAEIGTVLHYTGSGTAMKLGTDGSSKVRNYVEGIEFSESGSGLVALEFEDVHIGSISKVKASGFTTSAIVMDGAWENTIQLCDLRNSDYLIDLRKDGTPGPHNIKIKENYLGAGSGNTGIRIGANAQDTLIENNNLADSQYAIHVPATGCDLLTIKHNYLENSGAVAATYFIYLQGSGGTKATDVRIEDNWWSGIKDATAIYVDYGDLVHIKGNAPRYDSGTSYFLQTTANHGYIIDESNWVAGGLSANVINNYDKYVKRGWQWFVTIQSPQSLTLNGSAIDIPVFHSETADYRIARITFLYTDATSADAGVVVRVGKESDDDYYYTFSSGTSQAKWVALNVGPLARDYAVGDTITFGTAGGKTGNGEVLLILELWANA